MKRRRQQLVPPLELERREVDAFVEREVSTADAFMTVVELGGRPVSTKSLWVAEFLKGMRFWERRGCIRLLMETDLQHVKASGPTDRERIVEEVESRFDAYYDALEKGGYL